MRAAVKPVLAVLAFALALACVLAPAAAVAAAPAGSFEDSLHLKRGRYHVTVGNLGSTVYLEAAVIGKGALIPTANTVYLARGTATESRLHASFGDLGEVSLRFHPSPSRTWVKPHRDCGKDSSLIRSGTWVGRLRFPGEDGYLGIDVKRVAGAVRALAPQCRHPKPRARPLIRPSEESFLGAEVPVLDSSWHHGLGSAELIAGSDEESSYFIAQSQEVVGRVAILRTARVSGPRKLFSADDALTAAHLSPPSPFHGSGSYRAAPDGAEDWTGPLSVNFPGAPRYPLTEAPFEPTLELIPELVLSLIGLFDHREGPASGLFANPNGSGPRSGGAWVREALGLPPDQA